MAGCLLSILIWKLDRSKLIGKVNDLIIKFVKNKTIVQYVYIFFLAVLMISFYFLRNNEIKNFITAFLVIDVSNTERKNLDYKDKTHFYDSISLISESLLCGFIAPLYYILILGNEAALAYMILYNLCSIDNFKILRIIFTVLSIIPSFFAQILLYIVYLTRNKKFVIDFKGDYLVNTLTRPLLNLDILGAYIESVNFYYHFNDAEIQYIKSYGEYKNKIDEICIKDYLSISYGICLIYFVMFFITFRLFV